MSVIYKDTCTPIILVIIGIAVVVYIKTLKHLMISRCTDIDMCCIKLKRNVVTDSIASEIASQP